MKAIELAYISLLTEVGLKSGSSLIRGSAYEGLQWCINDAPKLEKELLDWIENGNETTVGWAWKQVWPRWLIPLRDRFCRTKSPIDLRFIRQLLLFCYKAEHTYTDETYQKAIGDYIDCNNDVRDLGLRYQNAGPSSRYTSLVRQQCTSALGFTDWREISPAHGPGAVYGHEIDKGMWRQWYSTIDTLYPYYEYFGISRFNYRDGAEDFVVNDEIVARMVAVPKDARGPRLICVHPQEAIWIQQGLRHKMEFAIQRHRPTKCGRWAWPQGHVHFNDQTVNANLALKASQDKDYATLDLKEASDRLSDILVQDLFGRHYKWFGCCRAQYVEIPSNGATDLRSRLDPYGSSMDINGRNTIKIPIHAYAPMGNATTFPVQSLVFWAMCVAILKARGFHQPADCYVFGDDIIVPNSEAPAVMQGLEEFGLVVNKTKSFYKGSFRESCGTDAYSGIDVTPTRWKTTYDINTLVGCQSLSSIAQRLRMRGFDETAKECYSILSKTLKRWHRTLPVTNDPEHGGIAEYTENACTVWRDSFWDPRYQLWCSPVLRLAQRELSLRHGWNHVLASLTSLQKTGRSCNPASTLSRRTQLNRGWARVL